MKRYLVAAAALLAGPALAADSDSTRVFADIGAECVINAQSAEIDVSNAAPNTWVNGVFAYQCNFIGSPTLTFTSLNGALVNPDNGGDSVDYGIYLNDAPVSGTPSSALLASTATGGGVVFNNITTTLAANQEVTPFFAVGPVAALTVAGTYEDVLSIEISP